MINSTLVLQMDSDLTLIGMVGHWMAATLQTAALYGQHHMLNTYGSFIVNAGALILTFCVIASVINIALQGNAPQLAYYLIGPGVFYWMLTFTTPVCSVKYQFGDYFSDDSCTELKTSLLTINDDYYGGSAKVSWFYANYDKLVSYIVQKTVSVLTPTADHEHIIKLARERLILRLARARASNPQFLKLLSIALMGDCAQQFLRAADMATIGPEDSQRSVIMDILGLDPNLNQDRMDTAWEEFELIREQPVYIDDPLRDFLRQDAFKDFVSGSGIDIEVPLTCAEVWQLTEFAAYLGALEEFEITDDDRELYPALTDENWETVVLDVRTKLALSPYLTGTTSFISGFGSDTESHAAIILSAFYIRNALMFNALGAMTVRGGKLDTYNEPAYRVDFATVAKHEGAANLMSLVQFAAYIPYVQGLLLYFLTILFPFFTLFLLIPGRQSSFALWLSLWAWVKSWDIGFAMVHELRNVIWHIMPNFAAENAMFNIMTGDFTNPATVLIMAFQNDPISHLNTYFFVVSTFTMGVPAISAQIFAGAAALYSAINKKGILSPEAKLYNPNANTATKSMGGDALEGKNNPIGLQNTSQGGSGNKSSLSSQGLSQGMGSGGSSGQREQSSPSSGRSPSYSPSAEGSPQGSSPSPGSRQAPRSQQYSGQPQPPAPPGRSPESNPALVRPGSRPQDEDDDAPGPGYNG